MSLKFKESILKEKDLECIAEFFAQIFLKRLPVKTNHKILKKKINATLALANNVFEKKFYKMSKLAKWTISQEAKNK